MTIAESKKSNNISEYIIHMYQTEDLIRVYEFDMSMIKEYVIKHIPLPELSKRELTEWYESILKKMQEEGLEEKGHLPEIQTYVNQLEELKTDLLATDNEFAKLLENAKPHIEEAIELSERTITSEVQICLNGIYGLLLARMNGKEVPNELMAGLNAYGDVLSYLSYKYKQLNYLSDN